MRPRTSVLSVKRASRYPLGTKNTSVCHFSELEAFFQEPYLGFYDEQPHRSSKSDTQTHYLSRGSSRAVTKNNQTLANER